MKTINISAGCPARIILGRRGENEATQVVFDCASFAEMYGDGTAVLLAKRPQDTSAYPVTVEQDGNTVTWTVTDADTAYRGSGVCELFWYVGETLAKSVVYTTVIGKDIGETSSDPPDAFETWVEQLTALGAETQQNATDAEQSADDAAASAAEITGMSAQAETLPAGSEATASYADGVLTLGIPRGADGSGGSGARYSFTDPNGDGNIIITEVG